MHLQSSSAHLGSCDKLWHREGPGKTQDHEGHPQVGKWPQSLSPPVTVLVLRLVQTPGFTETNCLPTNNFAPLCFKGGFSRKLALSLDLVSTQVNW